MHHTCLCSMPCVCGGCLLCCLFLSGLLLSLASVSFRSCEDSFDYVRLSPSWTRSSSLRDLRQDDHPSKSLLSLLASCSFYCYAALPSTCLSSLPNCNEHLTFVTLPSKPLFGYVTALFSPSYSVASCRWSLEAVPCWSIFYLLVGISQYLLFN